MTVVKSSKFGRARFGTGVFGTIAKETGYSLGQQGDTNVNLGVGSIGLGQQSDSGINMGVGGVLPILGENTDSGIQNGVRKR